MSIEYLSPLRYPGAKRWLTDYLIQVLQLNNLKPELFVEPFAGGASVSLRLLADGHVKRIGLIDRDPLVAAFWYTVFFDTDWLVQQVETVDVTLDQWCHFKRLTTDERRQRAMACLFLNRTSFSGILAPCAGPIGGKKQSSAYTLGCRFPREALIERIRRLHGYRKQVAFVWNVTWNDGLLRIAGMQNRGSLPRDVFYYLDPPFFEKADRLYTYFFTDIDHQRLRDALIYMRQPWLLSYDSATRVYALYEDHLSNAVRFETLYSASGSGRRSRKDEVIISNQYLPSDVGELILPNFTGTPEDGRLKSIPAVRCNPREVVTASIP